MRMDIRDISRFSPAAQKQILAKLGKAAAPRESKYKSCRTPRTLPDGKVHTFDSKKEADRFGDLLMLMKAGKIRDLRLQVEFTLVEGYITVTGKRVKPIKYKADFTYTELEMRTPENGENEVIQSLDFVIPSRYQEFGLDVSNLLPGEIGFMSGWHYGYIDGKWSAWKMRKVVEDVKGVRTKEYEIKRKLMLDKYGIVIRET